MMQINQRMLLLEMAKLLTNQMLLLTVAKMLHRNQHQREALQDSAWEGVTRRVNEIVTTKTAMLANHDHLASVESKVENVESDVAMMKSEMADLKIMMARLLEQTKPRA